MDTTVLLPIFTGNLLADEPDAYEKSVLSFGWRPGDATDKS